MKTKQWLLGMAVIPLIGCSGVDKSADGASGHQGYALGEAAENAVPWSKSSDALDQGWDNKTKMEWWFTSQGSRIIPYDWFLALERAGSEELIRSDENITRFRYITQAGDTRWNPDALPIGFVADKDVKSGKSYLGLSCAACHTGQVNYQGKRLLVEGAPTLGNFDGLITDISDGMIAARDNPDKFARFAERVLGKGASSDALNALKGHLIEESVRLAARLLINRPTHPNGNGRLDAFGNIFNQATVFAIDEVENVKPVNAPVSYPVLWDTPQHDVVQWNGSAVNAGIGPYVRNVGEVVGVFGGTRVEIVEELGHIKKPRYHNHVSIKGVKHLEEILTTLWSPLWPEGVLPPIDHAKAEKGKQHYDKQCRSCHSILDRTDKGRRIKATLIPVEKVGTDSTMALNIAHRKSKTGILEGQQKLPVTKYLPNLGLIPRFGKEAHSVEIVGNIVVGILRDELKLSDVDIDLFKETGAFLEASKKFSKIPPSYKARPLNGIWASAPFLHNGSVPNLWELLQKPEERVDMFHVGSWEMDPVKVGYVTEGGPNTTRFDTTIRGNYNTGHNHGTGLDDSEKWELIEYIKTL